MRWTPPRGRQVEDLSEHHEGHPELLPVGARPILPATGTGGVVYVGGADEFSYAQQRRPVSPSLFRGSSWTPNYGLAEIHQRDRLVSIWLLHDEVGVNALLGPCVSLVFKIR